MKKLGIIAGSGELPAQIIKSCEAENRPFFVLGIEDNADKNFLSEFPHKMVRIGAVGEALKILKSEKIEEIIMAGRVKRPTLASLRPDITATMLIAKLGKNLFSGDDSILSNVISILEKEGLAVVGVADVCANLLAKKGILGKHKPNKEHQADIARGIAVAKKLGEVDVGQSVIVEKEYVLGVEAAEGTAALIERIGKLPQHEKKSGVLIKMKKPTQDKRADLPTIGKETIEQAYHSSLAGIAIEAGSCLILEMEQTIELANKYGLFITGIEAAEYD